MNCVELLPDQILEYLPQKRPFRFVDKILEVNEQFILGEYTFKKDEFFYAGHFPDNPITPGVILVESMCQVGVVSFGIYLLSKMLPEAEIQNWLTLFSDAEVEFFSSVLPEQKIIIRAEKIFFRRMKLRCKIEMRNPEGKLLATALASGLGVKK